MIKVFCKSLTARLKGCGMRWHRRNAEAIMPWPPWTTAISEMSIEKL
jgi:hypothetical protein